MAGRKNDRSRNRREEYVKLERRLVLIAWLNDQFGYENNRDLLADVKDAGEGFDPYGQSYVFHRLNSRGDMLKIQSVQLGRYDENIKRHLDTINAHRSQPITLRYFQYLALLYSEIFLDRLFNHRKAFLRELNRFVRDRNARKSVADPPDSRFKDSDLTKLAYWMATGSGKTLIMHFNYLQFLHYNQTPLDNILLITPNEGLTEQHMEEMRDSGIRCERFNMEESGLGLGGQNVVRVIEITKLVEEKRGGGVSVDVECFDGNNLIFVDEGHKGSGGEAWRRFRDKLGQTGFTFEYSATFGQALTAARKDALTEEYGKAIVFDYSYKYFYDDGYGKDFHVLNLREETSEDKTDELILANLLSFYEQTRLYKDHPERLKPYSLEKPLWVFVGSSVNAVYTEAKRKRSDVLTVARFLNRFLENRNNWSLEVVGKVIEGKTGLTDKYGEDVFAGKFEYLQRTNADAAGIYREVLSDVFHSPVGGSLHLAGIRGSAGELGLKVGGAEDYFGLIYIGDTSAFKKLVEEDDSGINVEEDAFTQSLFDQLSRPDSPINVLIGAKKFMEGWNSWRVSNMGLLNIGRSEGSEIIQLFGRGVRLKGLNFSLKRSSAINGEHPDQIRLLETLNIFAVRANYMAQFKDYLEREGVDTEGYVELPLAIKPNEEFLKKDLLIPRVPSERRFIEEHFFVLESDEAVKVTVDMSLKVESLQSGKNGITESGTMAGKELTIPQDSLDVLDWEAIYLQLLEYKEQKGFLNLVIRPDDARRILSSNNSGLYKLIADEIVVIPPSFSEVSILENAVLSILRKYVDKFYRVHQERWDSEHMVYQTLKSDDPNFQDYMLQLSRSEKELIKSIKLLIDKGERIYQEELRELPNIHFDRHLYQPLLVERGDKIKSIPEGLKDSERKLVKDLRDYVRIEADGSLASKEIFLLRNLSKGKGVGFFENEGFFPDFILWIKESDKQRIVFVEPHGMRYEKAYWSDDKVRLHERLREFSQKLAEDADLKNISLDSFIISATPYDELREYYGEKEWSKDRFTNAHVLFLDDGNYTQMLFRA